MLTNSQIWDEHSGIPVRFRGCNFENYETSDKKMQEIKSTIEGKLYDTILCGGVGTGKTHLACAKVRQVIWKGYQSRYIETIKMIRDIKQSWGDRDRIESDVLKKYGEDIPFLVIDEIGVQFGSDTEIQYLTEIINDRYNNKRKTYLVTNLDLGQLTDVIGERIIDRFRDGGKILVFSGSSYRGKK